MTNQNQKTKQELIHEAWDEYRAKVKPLSDEYEAKVKPLSDEYEAKKKEIKEKFKNKCEKCGK